MDFIYKAMTALKHRGFANLPVWEVHADASICLLLNPACFSQVDH